jgi:hypothetical protein
MDELAGLHLFNPYGGEVITTDMNHPSIGRQNTE